MNGRWRNAIVFESGATMNTAEAGEVGEVGENGDLSVRRLGL